MGREKPDWPREAGLLCFVFEAFREPWKGSPEPLLQVMGARAMGGSSRQFADHVQAQIHKWREVVQVARIALD